MDLTYPGSLPDELLGCAENMLRLSDQFTNALIMLNWSEDAIRAIHHSKRKAYKFFGDSDFARGYCHIPSRPRRCILEAAGEVLRSQHKRMEFFYAMIGALKDDEDALCLTDHNEVNLAENIRRQILNYVEDNGGWPEAYVEMGTSSLDQPLLTYAPDDGQAVSLSYDKDNGEIEVQIKLPTSERPTRSQWRWFKFKTAVYGRLRKLLDKGARLLKPRLRLLRVKSGLRKAVLDIIVEVPEAEPKESARILPVDTGVRKVATAVLMNSSGEQLSKPLFIKNVLLGRLLLLKDKADALKKRLSKLPKNSMRHAHFYAEWKQCWNKINHILYQVRHHTSLTLVKLAKRFEARVIVLEELDSYNAPRGKGRLSNLLNTTFLRALHRLVEYKAGRFGVAVSRVSSYKTSQKCPRCGGEGIHVSSPRSKTPCKRGAYFYCPKCKYTADQDYVGALNIGRAYLNGGYVPKEDSGSRYMPLPSLTAGRSFVSNPPSLHAPITTAPLSLLSRLGNLRAETTDCTE